MKRSYVARCGVAAAAMIGAVALCLADARDAQAVVPPGSLTVPTSSSTGNYVVSWTASTTSGVTYELQEWTHPDLLDAVTVYTGTGLSASRTGRTFGVTYRYRVRALGPYGDGVSLWTYAANGCTVVAQPTAGAPGAPVVPATSSTGTYTVSWSASATSGASYELEEATNTAFTAGLRTAYTGTALSTSITGRPAGATYYYRVRATASGYIPSPWSTGANGCAVTSASTAAAPGTPIVPATSTTGNYTVAWSASATSGASYELQEATNTSFTAGLRTAYTGTGLSASITGRSVGVTDYYRVRATASGMTASQWVPGEIGCTVSPAAVTLGFDYDALGRVIRVYAK